MKNCASVEMLLYLYREGELTVEERATLSEHLATCPRCRELERELLAMDAALRPERDREPGFSPDPGLIDETMRRIGHEGNGGLREASAISFFEPLLGWLQPALSLALLVLAVLFLVQQSRDAAQLSALDARLGERGARPRSGAPLMTPADARSRFLMGDESGRMLWSSPGMASAAPVSDLLSASGLGLGEVFGQRRGLFEALSRRYPHLSSVNPDDGIDARERAILATEGKSLLNELERMIREGELRQ